MQCSGAESISGCEDVMTGCDDCGGAGPHTPSLEAGESCVTDLLLSTHYQLISVGALSEAQGNSVQPCTADSPRPCSGC